MLSWISARDYRCLKQIDQAVDPFQILVGPNASGKSTFLEVVSFFADVVSESIREAVRKRTETFEDLVWGRRGTSFNLSIEARIPPEKRIDRPAWQADTIRYALKITLDPSTESCGAENERVFFYNAERGLRDNLSIVRRKGSSIEFRSENTASDSTPAQNSFNVPNHLSALANLPDDKAHFPASVWLKDLLKEGVQAVVLDPTELRKPSPPLRGTGEKFSGANLGRLVAQLLLDEQRAADWQAHLRTVLPDLKAIRTVLREEDRSRYVQVQYENGIEVPSWFLSDGTLRLMALTLLAYSPKSEGIYLIEEPENGVHPTALEAIFQSLTSVYEGQVFIATHSPVLLSLTKPEQLLCFSKTPQGTEIKRGDQHPVLQDWDTWKGEANLSDYFAAGVLG